MKPKYWKAASSAKHVLAVAYSYHDAKNGNSYISTRIYINEGFNNAFEIRTNMQYMSPSVVNVKDMVYDVLTATDIATLNACRKIDMRVILLDRRTRAEAVAWGRQTS